MKKILASIFLSGTLTLGGVDASVIDVKPLPDRNFYLAGEVVNQDQTENRVSAAFPWKGEPGIVVKYDMGEPTLGERFADKRKEQVITEVADFGEGGLKMDIILNSKPDTNRFCYQIEGYENYDFFYQPPLTQEEIDEGAFRPEEIVGSYAVYHKTLKNHRLGEQNYATGKVMHIPFPYVWEVNNEEATKQRAEDLTYNDGQLCVVVQQDFLDGANYPVRVDPTFGYTTIGASNSGSNSCRGHRLASGLFYTASSGDVVTSFSVYSNSVVAEYGVAAYTTNGTIPVDRVSTMTLFSSDGSAGWFTSAPVSIALSASTEYTLAWQNSVTTSGVLVFDTGAANSVSREDTTNLTCEDPFVENDTSTPLYSVYATYTAGGAAENPQSIQTDNGSIEINNGSIIIDG